MSGYWSGILAILCINVVVAYAVFLPAAAGQLNLGAAGLMAIGAYTSGYLDAEYGLSLWVAIPAGGLMTALVGFLVAFPIMRTRGVYMVLATFAFSEVVGGVIINSETLGAAAGYPINSYAGLKVLLPVCLATMAFVYVLMSTRFGLAMRAVHDDEQVALLFGVNVRLTKVMAFTIGGFLGGVAGALYGHQFNYVEVQNFNALLSIYVLLFVLIGGTQTAFGPLIGAGFFTMLPEFLRVSEEWRFVIFGGLIVLMMVVRPEGMITRTMFERALSLLRKIGPGQGGGEGGESGEENAGGEAA